MTMATDPRAIPADARRHEAMIIVLDVLRKHVPDEVKLLFHIDNAAPALNLMVILGERFHSEYEKNPIDATPYGRDVAEALGLPLKPDHKTRRNSSENARTTWQSPLLVRPRVIVTAYRDAEHTCSPTCPVHCG